MVIRTLLLAAAFLCPMGRVSLAASPGLAEDPLGLDAGPARDEEAFLEWVKAPRERPHPVMTFKNLVHHDPKLRPDYRAFLCRQAGLRGKAARLVVALSEEVFLRDPLTTGDLVTLEDRLKLEASDKRARELGKRFFREIPRAQRLRVYKIAEKLQYARLAVIDMVRTGNKYAWMAGWKKLEWDREEGYLYGMENGKDEEYAARVDEDFKLTMDFILTFAGPPSYLDKPERERIRAERRKKRAMIIKGLRPFDL